MKAMILAAGLGTRLRPFTDSHPKALYKYNGKFLLEHALDHLRQANIHEVIINVHHFADQIIEFLHRNHNFGFSITVSDEREALLDTGGGVKKASSWLTGHEPVLIRNVDVISDIDLSRLALYHTDTGALATLAIRNRATTRYLLFDHDLALTGWENLKTGEKIFTGKAMACYSYAFSGIQVISPEIFPLMTESGAFSLISLYLRLAKDYKIAGYLETGYIWKDVGTM